MLIRIASRSSGQISHYVPELGDGEGDQNTQQHNPCYKSDSFHLFPPDRLNVCVRKTQYILKQKICLLPCNESNRKKLHNDSIFLFRIFRVFIVISLPSKADLRHFMRFSTKTQSLEEDNQPTSFAFRLVSLCPFTRFIRDRFLPSPNFE